VAIQFRERDPLGDVTRAFESSEDLIHWSEIAPTEINLETNSNGVSVLQAVFPIQQSRTFYRIHYHLEN
jgi:hypothetical protein